MQKNMYIFFPKALSNFFFFFGGEGYSCNGTLPTLSPDPNFYDYFLIPTHQKSSFVADIWKNVDNVQQATTGNELKAVLVEDFHWCLGL